MYVSLCCVAFCLFAVFVRGLKRPILFVTWKPHQHFPQWLLHHPQHNFGCLFPQPKRSLEMTEPSVLSWRGKNKKTLNRIFESGLRHVNTVVRRATSAPPLSLHAICISSHPTPSPSSCFLWILPAAPSFPPPSRLTARTTGLTCTDDVPPAKIDSIASSENAG